MNLNQIHIFKWFLINLQNASYKLLKKIVKLTGFGGSTPGEGYTLKMGVPLDFLLYDCVRS